MTAADNIHPIFDRVLRRSEKEARLKQRARVIWLYGLSGSGKSTLAVALERRLFAEGFTTHLLDGDNVRSGLNRGLGFSDADRVENIRRVAEVAKLFAHAGVVPICSFITPLKALRESAREIIGAEDFFDVYVKASFETCARRDPKGLYAKAGAGGVKQFTGKDSAFEEPAAGEVSLVIDTEAESPEASLDHLHAAVRPNISLT
ncbi:adenylyl-sulfate kinase [Nibricoccus aquaticus]|uniref:Adenylyl-sulfate kinase n=1 Tax=Nibricoccus aquaticus TaxID=2576891 RepID=A0A290Q1W4_9BACT|nr:adenylyl-sulfate kinase [Nibricoccus aquaticus]ATC62635.1 adenylyl-sulfate kinase [Nibricoccus aquaticus]